MKLGLAVPPAAEISFSRMGGKWVVLGSGICPAPLGELCAHLSLQT